MRCLSLALLNMRRHGGKSAFNIISAFAVIFLLCITIMISIFSEKTLDDSLNRRVSGNYVKIVNNYGDIDTAFMRGVKEVNEYAYLRKEQLTDFNSVIIEGVGELTAFADMYRTENAVIPQSVMLEYEAFNETPLFAAGRAANGANEIVMSEQFFISNNIYDYDSVLNKRVDVYVTVFAEKQPRVIGATLTGVVSDKLADVALFENKPDGAAIFFVNFNRYLPLKSADTYLFCDYKDMADLSVTAGERYEFVETAAMSKGLEKLADVTQFMIRILILLCLIVLCVIVVYQVSAVYGDLAVTKEYNYSLNAFGLSKKSVFATLFIEKTLSSCAAAITAFSIAAFSAKGLMELIGTLTGAGIVLTNLFPISFVVASVALAVMTAVNLGTLAIGIYISKPSNY